MSVIPLRQAVSRPMDAYLPVWRHLVGADHAVRGDYGEPDQFGVRHAYDWDGPCPCDPNLSHELRISEDRRDRSLTFTCEAGTNGWIVKDIFDLAIAEGPTVLDVASDGDSRSSWEAVDLMPIVAGEQHEQPPTILARTDGSCLFTRGKTHSVFAEPEACKGWLAMHASAQTLTAGDRVVYIDFEDTAATAVARLSALGVPDETITRRFVYLQPDEPLGELGASFLDSHLAMRPALVIFDGMTEALGLEGLGSNDNDDITVWVNMQPRRCARAGAAAVTLDHVTKDRESRGRYAIGGQAKLAAVDVAYSLDVVKPFGRGREGRVKVTVRKDRPGFVREFAHDGAAAMMRLTSGDDGAVTVALELPDTTGAAFKPTYLMERLSRAIEESPGLTARGVRAVKGNHEAKKLALAQLIAGGYVTVNAEGQALQHHSVEPYREDDRAPVPTPCPDREQARGEGNRAPCPPPFKGHGTVHTTNGHDPTVPSAHDEDQAQAELDRLQQKGLA